MKRFYFQFRIMLITFAFGLACFYFFDGVINGVIEPLVDLPKVKSEEILVVYPKYKCEVPHNGAGHPSLDILKAHYNCNK